MNKLLLTLILLTAAFQSAVSQAPFVVNWAEKYQHSTIPHFSNETRQIVVDNNSGNIYSLVDVTSNIDPAGNATGLTHSYVKLLKYGQLGNLIATAQIEIGMHSGNGFDLKSSFGLHVDASGNVYVGYMNYNATTAFDVNVRKYNSSLAVLWTYTFNGASIDEGLQMKVSSTGIAYVLAKSLSTPSDRYRLIKANAQGVSTNSFYTFGLNVDYPSAIELDNANNIFVTGYKQTIPSVAKSILITSITPAGLVKWTAADNCGTTTGDDIGNKITYGADGNIYVTGSSVGVTSHGLDVITLKYSTDGRKSWQSLINMTLTDGGYFVSVPNANTVNVGWRSGNTIYVEEMSTLTGLSWRRIPYTPVPSSSYTAITGLTFTDMQVSNGSSVYVTGSITATSGGQTFQATYLAKLTFVSRGPAVIQLAQPRDGHFAVSRRAVKIALNNVTKKIYWACDIFENYTTHSNEKSELTSLSGLGTFRFEENSVDNSIARFKISPNPARNDVQVSTGEIIKEYAVFNISGVQQSDKILGTFISETDLNIDISNLASGIYFISIKTESGNELYEKIVKN